MIPVKPKMPKEDRLANQMLQYRNVDRIVISRNFSYGGCAACFVILMSLFQTGIHSDSLQISLIAAVIGLPMWLLLGSAYEFYIFLGKKSYPHRVSSFGKRFFSSIITVAHISLFISITAIINSLSHDAMYWFLGISFICLLLFGALHEQMAEWIYKEESLEDGGSL